MLRLSGLPDQTVWAVAILLFSALVITTSLYGLVVTYEYNQAAFIKTLSRNNRRLAKELTLVNQKLWVEKREWALRLHGSVQSSLTAAVARLSGAGTPSTVQLAKVREHLSQAMKGLRAPAAKPVNLRESLKEIKRTWAGIAKINADLNSDAAKHVLVDGLGGVIANEIIKEAVSNSITHGKSDQVMIRFETPRPGFLEIIVQDNGRGISRKSRLGLGTQILDEIAFPWSIQNQPTGGTILRAQIALSPKKRRATIK
jgi:signal transduction histidine kinase